MPQRLARDPGQACTSLCLSFLTTPAKGRKTKLYLGAPPGTCSPAESGLLCFLCTCVTAASASRSAGPWESRCSVLVQLITQGSPGLTNHPQMGISAVLRIFLLFWGEEEDEGATSLELHVLQFPTLDFWD